VLHKDYMTVRWADDACINVAPDPCRKSFSHGLDPNWTQNENRIPGVFHCPHYLVLMITAVTLVVPLSPSIVSVTGTVFGGLGIVRLTFFAMTPKM
jgi:hypothetical protein